MTRYKIVRVCPACWRREAGPRLVQNAVEEFRVKEKERLGSTRTRDGDVLKILVFLQHFALDRNNGRQRGRAFVDALRGFYPPPSAPSLILP